MKKLVQALKSLHSTKNQTTSIKLFNFRNIFKILNKLENIKQKVRYFRDAIKNGMVTIYVGK